MGFILNKCTMMMILSKYFSNGVSGFLFQCAIQNGSILCMVSCIGLSGVLDCTVRQCYDYLSLMADYEGQTKVEYLTDVR
jgi:hypothetical protein